MWRVRAACHHAEAVRDEEEVGDRDGVAVGLEHTLLIGCMIYGYTGDGYALCIWYADEMQMECILYIWVGVRYYSRIHGTWFYFEEVLLPAFGPHGARVIVRRPPRLQHFGVAGGAVA